MGGNGSQRGFELQLGMTTESENPYASPAIVVTPDVPPPKVEALETEEERIRRLHLSVETSIRTLGAVGYILGVLWGVLALSFVLQPRAYQFLVDAALWSMAAVGFFAEGHALRKLSQLAGNILAIAACLAIIAILCVILWTGATPLLISVPIAAYPIYLVRSKKGQFVFSQEYAKIRQQTPYMVYRPQAVQWTPGGALLILFFILTVILVMLLRY